MCELCDDIVVIDSSQVAVDNPDNIVKTHIITPASNHATPDLAKHEPAHLPIQPMSRPSSYNPSYTSELYLALISSGVLAPLDLF